MTAPAHHTGGALATSLTARARHFLSRRFISRLVAAHQMQEAFLRSQSCLVGVSWQEYLLERVGFQYFMRGPEATDSETYKQFLRHLNIAEKIGDDSPFKALAR